MTDAHGEQPAWADRPEPDPGTDRESFLGDLRKASRRVGPRAPRGKAAGASEGPADAKKPPG